MAKKKKKAKKVVKVKSAKPPEPEQPKTADLNAPVMIPLSLAIDIATYINETPSPNFPVQMSMNILTRLQGQVNAAIGEGATVTLGNASSGR